MRKRSRRRTKRVIGYGFISENIMNLLGRPAIKVAGKAMAKAAASALGKAAAKAAGSKIGNMVANKILPASVHAAELPPAPPRDELIAGFEGGVLGVRSTPHELNETTSAYAPTREEIFKSVNLLLPTTTMNDDCN